MVSQIGKWRVQPTFEGNYPLSRQLGCHHSCKFTTLRVFPQKMRVAHSCTQGSKECKMGTATNASHYFLCVCVCASNAFWTPPNFEGKQMKLERPSIRAKRQGSLSTEWDSTLPSWQSYVVAGYKPPFQSRIAGNWTAFCPMLRFSLPNRKNWTAVAKRSRKSTTTPITTWAGIKTRTGAKRIRRKVT